MGLSDVAAATVWAIGRQSHPSVSIAAETFSEQITGLLPSIERASANDVQAHAADIYLVGCCLLGVPSALAVLERDYFAHVPRFIARIDGRTDFADEVAQLLRERFLSPASMKLAGYGGSGPLLAFVRIAARRLAIDLQRRAGVERLHVDAMDGAWEFAAGGPEWELLRERYREPLEQAIRRAVAALSSRERMVLRLYLFGGENIEKIGKTYGVHRATVARWIVAAQDRIVAAVRAELGARYGVTDAECDSLARALCSRLNVSLTGLL